MMITVWGYDKAKGNSEAKNHHLVASQVVSVGCDSSRLADIHLLDGRTIQTEISDELVLKQLRKASRKWSKIWSVLVYIVVGLYAFFIVCLMIGAMFG